MHKIIYMKIRILTSCWMINHWSVPRLVLFVRLIEAVMLGRSPLCWGYCSAHSTTACVNPERQHAHYNYPTTLANCHQVFVPSALTNTRLFNSMCAIATQYDPAACVQLMVGEVLWELWLWLGIERTKAHVIRVCSNA